MREIATDSTDAWSREGAVLAMSAAYPPYLERGAPVPPRYFDEAYAVAGRQAALAGYRLARALERIFAGASESARDLLPRSRLVLQRAPMRTFE